LDIMLPVLNGVEVARHVRQADHAPPIVACSAAFNDEVESHLRDLGVRDFLRKPFDGHALQTTLARSMLREAS
jgi:CheY-like chemotaxis protein